MNLLQLNFQSTTEDFLLEIYIDKNVIQYTKVDNSIIIEGEIPLGFHMLEVKLLSDSADITFNNALLDGVSFRQTLYTMFTLAGDKKRQTTMLKTSDRTVYLPFANPLSHWIATCEQTVPHKLYSDNLYEKLAVYYPESITISDSFPKLLRDYFQTNFNFYVHPAGLLDDPYLKTTVPYAPVPQTIEYDERAIYDELMLAVKQLTLQTRDPKQNIYNKLESNQKNYWSVIDFILSYEGEYTLESKFNIDKELVPNLYKLIEQLNLTEILHAFVGVLGPGAYIAPHVDDYYGLEHIIKKYPGCSQIYFPINWRPGNYFKLHNVGLIPLTNRPFYVNNHNFSHALVNDSDEYRFAIGVVGSKLDA